jgi:hypothetical protein
MLKEVDKRQASGYKKLERSFVKKHLTTMDKDTAIEYAKTTVTCMAIMVISVIFFPVEIDRERVFQVMYSVISLGLGLTTIIMTVKMGLWNLTVQYCYFIELSVGMIAFFHTRYAFPREFLLSFMVNSIGAMPITFRVFRSSFDMFESRRFMNTYMHTIPLLYAIFLRFFVKKSPNLFTSEQWDGFLKDMTIVEIAWCGFKFYLIWFVLHTVILLILFEPYLLRNGYTTFWKINNKAFKLFNTMKDCVGVEQDNHSWSKWLHVIVHFFLGMVAMFIGAAAVKSFSFAMGVLILVFLHTCWCTVNSYSKFFGRHYTTVDEQGENEENKTN